MDDRNPVTKYNYNRFVFGQFDRWLKFDTSPSLDRLAPDFPLRTLDGQETYLSQIWAQHTYTLVEFGSMTCPLCKMHAPALNEIARRYRGEGVGAILIYTHEVYPGENYPHLTSLTQKFHHARQLRKAVGMGRPILVDSLDGTCHRAYGSMPNMSWIFDRVGRPVYKSSWTDVNSVASAIEYLLGVLRRTQAGEQLRPIQVELQVFHTDNWEAFHQCLEENGPKAVREYDGAFRDYLAYVP